MTTSTVSFSSGLLLLLMSHTMLDLLSALSNLSKITFDLDSRSNVYIAALKKCNKA